MNTLSVVVPVLDEVDHLGECLTLLLDQGDDIDRIVVVDNGSTDGTLQLVDDVRAVDDKVARYRSYQEHGLASPELRRIVATDWMMHTLRRPISRLFAAVPSRALPVDDRAESDERIRAAA
ncbi:glycosyltransferase family A protein [Rhodococcus sp. 077-4]|uniref:glycosyltransferase family A protein n=1 Tax=Rhodococcus sp. 077-4 TaxID=2789271 RepID=UPI0039F5D454